MRGQGKLLYLLDYVHRVFLRLCGSLRMKQTICDFVGASLGYRARLSQGVAQFSNIEFNADRDVVFSKAGLVLLIQHGGVENECIEVFGDLVLDGLEVLRLRLAVFSEITFDRGHLGFLVRLFLCQQPSVLSVTGVVPTLLTWTTWALVKVAAATIATRANSFFTCTLR